MDDWMLELRTVELEKDVICETTYRKIISHDNFDYDEHLVDDKIRMNYF
jgi:hypothetical protein